MTGGAVVMVIGGFLMTHLTAGVSDWELWAWMLVLGLGIGPAMAGFTIVVQNSVPIEPPRRCHQHAHLPAPDRRLGRAGGGRDDLLVVLRQPAAGNLAQAGVPAVADSSTGEDFGRAAERGQRSRPARARPARRSCKPLIPKIIAGANNALALSIGDLFWITIVSGLLGLACTLLLRDRPLRSAADLRSAALAAAADDPKSEDGAIAGAALES